MTRLDYWAGIATYGGALVMLAGLIGGWLWPLTLGGIALAVGLLALNTSESAPPRASDGRTGAAPSPVTKPHQNAAHETRRKTVRPWRVLTRNIGAPTYLEAGRFWTRAAAQRWALAHQEQMLDLWIVRHRKEGLNQ